MAGISRVEGDDEMKTVTRYEIRKFEGNGYSKSLNYGQRLRDRKRAMRLVKALKARGLDVFAAPVRLAA